LSTSNNPVQKFALDMTLGKDWSGVTKSAQMELAALHGDRMGNYKINVRSASSPAVFAIRSNASLNQR
jgi:hypothetical protein